MKEFLTEKYTNAKIRIFWLLHPRLRQRTRELFNLIESGDVPIDQDVFSHSPKLIPGHTRPITSSDPEIQKMIDEMRSTQPTDLGSE